MSKKIPTEHLALAREALQRYIAETQPGDYLTTPNGQENLDLAVLAYETALQSLLLVADRAHCLNCHDAVLDMACGLLSGGIPITAPAAETAEPLIVITANSPEESEVVYAAILAGEDPEQALADYRREHGITATPTRH